MVTEQELLATVVALRIFSCYLLSGKQFNLVTDNKPNTCLQSQPTLSRHQAHWSEHLRCFHFNWVHRAGRHNVADPLGRNPASNHLDALLAVSYMKPTGNRFVSDLYFGPAPVSPAPYAGHQHRRGASPLATGVITISFSGTQQSADVASSSQQSVENSLCNSAFW